MSRRRGQRPTAADEYPSARRESTAPRLNVIDFTGEKVAGIVRVLLFLDLTLFACSAARGE